MNKTIILSIFCVILVQCSPSRKVQDNTILIDINVMGKMDSIAINRPGETCYLTNIELVNNTDSTFKYWTMTCAWQVNWVSDNDSLRLLQEDCTRNFPVIEEINMRDKVLYKGIICVKNNLINVEEQSFKLGLVLIKDTDLSESSDFLDTLFLKSHNGKYILWSEPFQLKMQKP